MLQCLICDKKSQDKELCQPICDFCFLQYGAITQSQNVLCLYQYQGLMRKIIMDAKIGRSPQAYRKVLKLLLSDRRVPHFIKGVDLIIPAPSSFRGRLFGQFDLAHEMASCLSKMHGTPIKKLSRRFYFEGLIKQAQKTARKNRDLETLSQKIDRRGKSCGKIALIVDDVLTSGETLAKTALRSKMRVRFLTLTKAARPKNSYL